MLALPKSKAQDKKKLCSIMSCKRVQCESGRGLMKSLDDASYVFKGRKRDILPL